MKNPFKKRDDSFASNSWGGVIKSVRGKERKRLWLLRARWRWITALVLIVLLAVGGYGVYLYYHLQGEIQVPIPNVDSQDDDEEPFNVLLVGSDSRAGLTEEEKESFGADDKTAEGPVTGERADTLILAHIDPETNRITMVQFPRDLYVPIAGGEENKINSALQGSDGRTTLVQTVKDLTGLPVNNYAQVNIAGFRNLVDAINGVKICITEPIPFDEQTGIEVTEEELPVVEFDGERALRFVRSRNFPTGDFQRIQNQQKFLSAAIGKITSVGTFLNLGRFRRLYSAAQDNVKTDDETGLMELYDILKNFQTFNPDDYEAYTVPNLGATTTEGGVSIVPPDLATMEVMFEAIGDNESPAEADGVPDVEVSTISVGVYNGTFEDGVASAAAEELTAATTVQGEIVNVVEVTNADRFNYRRTVVRYDDGEEGAEEKAQLIAAALPEARLKVGDTSSADVEVIVGKRSFVAEKIVQIRPIDLPPPGTQPEECRRELG